MHQAAAAALLVGWRCDLCDMMVLALRLPGMISMPEISSRLCWRGSVRLKLKACDKKEE